MFLNCSCKKSPKEQAMTNARVCNKGHQYYKSCDCPTCPFCEKERKPKSGFIALLAAPARRALENKGITTLGELSAFSEKEILALHGMGPGSIPKLINALKQEGFSFKISKK
jgi:DNA-directed RNA polymerase alpha subunit